jgi:hypothetical protein
VEAFFCLLKKKEKKFIFILCLYFVRLRDLVFFPVIEINKPWLCHYLLKVEVIGSVRVFGCVP